MLILESQLADRLEASRKYLFGSVGVLGEANNSVISGVLILRGKDYKPVVDVAPDWESYTYEAIDLSNADQKKFFEGALAWDLEVDGKKWADGKNVSFVSRSKRLSSRRPDCFTLCSSSKRLKRSDFFTCLLSWLSWAVHAHPLLQFYHV